jgi:hypothetical protein
VPNGVAVVTRIEEVGKKTSGHATSRSRQFSLIVILPPLLAAPRREKEADKMTSLQ